MSSFSHQSVLATEVLELLRPKPDGIYLDGTLGGGGHSELILEASAPTGVLIGIDQDPAALEAASARLARFGARFRPIAGRFGDLAHLVNLQGIEAVDGIVLDLGVSSHQLDSAERGFSFRLDGPLDMRMNSNADTTAADLLRDLPASELERIIRDFGEERWAKKIAARIEQVRQQTPLFTTLQLADLVAHTIPRRFHEERIHPATRTFQALRIAVNGELEQVEQGVRAGLALLRPGGRIAVISFHSLEDRLIKQHFRTAATGCVCPPKMPLCTCGRKPRIRLITGKPVVASEAERERNPRARSAKLRVAEKLSTIE